MYFSSWWESFLILIEKLTWGFKVNIFMGPISKNFWSTLWANLIKSLESWINAYRYQGTMEKFFYQINIFGLNSFCEKKKKIWYIFCNYFVWWNYGPTVLFVSNLNGNYHVPLYRVDQVGKIYDDHLLQTLMKSQPNKLRWIGL